MEGDMKIFILILLATAMISLTGCDTIPGAGVNANNSGVSTNAGWGPVNGSINTGGGVNVNAY